MTLCSFKFHVLNYHSGLPAPPVFLYETSENCPEQTLNKTFYRLHQLPEITGGGEIKKKKSRQILKEEEEEDCHFCFFFPCTS
jgi:hypothetical protein